MFAELFAGFCAGGILVGADFLEEGRKTVSERRPRDAYFWFGMFFWPLVGLFFTWVNIDSGVDVNTIGAAGIGLSAPTTLYTLIQKGGALLPPPSGAEE